MHAKINELNERHLKLVLSDDKAGALEAHMKMVALYAEYRYTPVGVELSKRRGVETQWLREDERKYGLLIEKYMKSLPEGEEPAQFTGGLHDGYDMSSRAVVADQVPVVTMDDAESAGTVRFGGRREFTDTDTWKITSGSDTWYSQDGEVWSLACWKCKGEGYIDYSPEEQSFCFICRGYGVKPGGSK